jgi:phage tail-like protein
MSQHTEKWAHMVYHFRVTIDGTQFSFKEVSGLESETQVAEYRDGDSLDFFTTKRAGLNKFGTLTLKRGVFTDESELLDMFNEVYDKHYMSVPDGRKDILVELLDEHGEAVMVWNCHKCFPTKLSISGFGSDKNEIAVEELAFAVESITVSI